MRVESEPFPAWSFTLSDVQFSVVAVLDENAVLRERVSYDPYGVGKHRWLAEGQVISYRAP